jgi:alkaline phosphatase D
MSDSQGEENDKADNQTADSRKAGNQTLDDPKSDGRKPDSEKPESQRADSHKVESHEEEPHPWWKRRSYIGLISLLIVILIFIGVLVFAGVGPLRQPSNQPASLPGTAPTQSVAANHRGNGVTAATPSAPHAVTMAALPSADTVITHIAFGSGLDQTGPLDILSVIAATKPQLFIFTGDTVVADAADPREAGDPSNIVTSPLMIRTAYAALGARPAYQSFETTVPIIATWDDHDFGLGDAGANFAYKQASKEAFFDFFRLPKDSLRYTQPDGIYTSYGFGPHGQRVQIILLDARWNRTVATTPLRPVAAGAPPATGEASTMLGDAQWAWLQQQLIEPADVRLIVSPVEVLANGAELRGWGELPSERDHLFDVLRDAGVKNVVLVSGGHGAAAIYKNDNALDSSLYEVSSSALNVSDNAAPPQDLQQIKPLYTDANFGVINIDWQARAIYLELHDKAGQLLQGVSVPLAPDQEVNQ